MSQDELDPVAGEGSASDCQNEPAEKPSHGASEKIAQQMVIDEKYRILDLLGKGAMGAVYRAEHIATARQVAVKILPDAGSDEAHSRMKQEAKAILAIRHPNIVAAYDFGFLPSGESYLVMDFIDGTSVETLIDSKTVIEENEIVDIASQVASGLAEAHSCGIVHRDIKPSNIVIFGSHGSLTAKIVDFGLARNLSDKSEFRLTQAGQLLGTPLYMSPEICSGLEPDARSDLYSLGCTMYEMITGEPPFIGENYLRLLYMHVNCDPQPLQTTERQSLSQELQAITMKLLEKDPDQRFQSASELVSALSKLRQRKGFALLGSKFLVGVKNRSILNGKRRVGKSRNRWLAATLVPLVVAATAAYAFANQDALWQTLNYEGQRAFDDGKYAQSDVELTLADWWTAILPSKQKTDGKLLAVGELSDLNYAMGQITRSQSFLAQFKALEVACAADQQAEVNVLIGRSLQELKRLAGEAPDAQRKLAIAEMCSHNLDTYVTGANYGGVSNYWQLLQLTEQLARIAEGSDGALMGRCLQDEGDYLYSITRESKETVALVDPKLRSRDYFERAANIYLKPGREFRERDRAYALAVLAKAFLILSSNYDKHSKQFSLDLARAYELAYQARRIYLRGGGLYDADLARAQVITARIMFGQGKLEQANDLLNQADVIYHHTGVVGLMDRFSLTGAQAEYLAGKGRFNEAETSLRSLLDLLERNLSPGRTELIMIEIMQRLANLNVDSHNYGPQCENVLARLIPMERRLFPSQNFPGRTLWAMRFAHHYALSRKTLDPAVYVQESAAARHCLEQVVLLSDSSHPDTSMSAQDLISLGHLCCVTDDPEKAIEAYRSAYQILHPRVNFVEFACLEMCRSLKDLATFKLAGPAHHIMVRLEELVKGDGAIAAATRQRLQNEIETSAGQTGVER